MQRKLHPEDHVFKSADALMAHVIDVFVGRDSGNSVVEQLRSGKIVVRTSSGPRHARER